MNANKVSVSKPPEDAKESDQASLGYSKFIDSNSMQENYNLPTTKNILAQSSTWQTHNPELASLGNTPMLAVKSVTSVDAAQYVAKHDLSQHNNYLDYAEAKNQGFAAGPSTAVTWNKSHQGNVFISHDGTMSQMRQVNTENLAINAPDINYQYGNRNSTYTGNQFTHTRINSTEITNNEQSIINNLQESTPSSQLSINQSIETYNSQTFNVENFTSYANQCTHSGPMFIDADSFDICEGSNILSQLQQQQQKYKQFLNQDNDYDLFVAVVYGEAADTEAAWEAVADSIILRARRYQKKPGQIVQMPYQYDAYYNPGVIKIFVPNRIMNQHGQFLKAYADLTKQKINGQNPMTNAEQSTLNKMYAELKPIYNQYQNTSPLKYTITNYYSPGAQAQLYHYQPSFLRGMQDPDRYLVEVPNVPANKFKFYNIPSQGK